MRSFKKTGAALLTVLVLAAVLWAADLALYPCTFTRNDVHAVATCTFDDVFVGTSHGKMNIDPETMGKVDGRTGHNLCVGGEYPEDVLYMVKLMIEKGHAPGRIVYEVSPGYFVREKEEGNNYLLFFHEFPLCASKLSYFRASVMKRDFRTLFFPWYEYDLSYELSHAGETLKTKLSGDYSAESFATEKQKYHENGFIERYPVDAEEFEDDEADEWFPEDIVEKNMESLREIIRLCDENGIGFTAITTPLPDQVLEEAGEGNAALNAYYAEFFEEAGVPYINFNYGTYYGMTDHTIDSFTDLDGHMNGDAARKFSAVLAEVLLDGAGGNAR